MSASTRAGTLSNTSPTTTIVGNLEDRRVWIRVYRNNGPRALHADEVLHGSRYPERHIELRAAVCPRLPTCRSGGSHSASQIGREAASSASRAAANCSRKRDVLLRLDAASDSDDTLGGGEVDLLAGLAEGRIWPLTDRRGVDMRRLTADRSAAGYLPRRSIDRKHARPNRNEGTAGGGPSNSTSASTLPRNIGRVRTTPPTTISSRGQSVAAGRPSRFASANKRGHKIARSICVRRNHAPQLGAGDEVSASCLRRSAFPIPSSGNAISARRIVARTSDLTPPRDRRSFNPFGKRGDQSPPSTSAQVHVEPASRLAL